MTKSKRLKKNKTNKLLNTGYYDPYAPKFKYVRQATKRTRKTSRVKVGDELYLGSEAPVDYKKSGEFGKYPWTKPLKGYKRVLVGYGRVVKKGRVKRGKGHKQFAFKTIKPSKRKFIPYSTTYGSDVSKWKKIKYK
jgi:hypothetical protein